MNLNKKKATCKMENSYILLAFLLMAVSLLIVFSVYCFHYCKRYQSKPKNTLRYYHSNNELIKLKIDINNIT